MLGMEKCGMVEKDGEGRQRDGVGGWRGVGGGGDRGDIEDWGFRGAIHEPSLLVVDVSFLKYCISPLRFASGGVRG